MKKYKELVCLLICYILIITPFSVQAAPSSGSGDNVVNNGSLIVKEGDWIYYRNSSDGGSIYKTNTDGTQNIKLNDISSCNINIQGDWIYFKSLSSNKFYEMYSMKKDGSSSPKDLNFSSSSNEKIAGGYIYYNYRSLSGGYSNRIKIDGTGNENLENKYDDDGYMKPYSPTIIGNYRYYVIKNTVFRCDLDGNNKIPIFTAAQDSNVDIEKSTDNWIYIEVQYDDLKHNTIYRIKQDGSEKNQIYNSGDDYGSVEVINDDWIYDGNENAFKKIDGSKTINESGYIDTYNMNSNNEWIYYYTVDDGSFYALKNDGTQKIKLYNGDGYFDTHLFNCIQDGNAFYYINGFYDNKFLYKFDITSGVSKQLTSEENIQQVSDDKKWTIVFTKKFDPSTINNSNILVTDGDNDPVDISVVPNADGKSITISKNEDESNWISANWSEDIPTREVKQVYNIKVTQNVKDIDGHKLKRNVVKKFEVK